MKHESRFDPAAYDFVEDRTHEGKKYWMLDVVDEFMHEALAIRVKRKLNLPDVIEVLAIDAKTAY